MLLPLTLALAIGLAEPPRSYDGNALLRKCTPALKVADGEKLTNAADDSDASWCMGYVTGVLDGLSQFDWKVCLPKEFTTGQALRIVVKYLKANPEVLHKEASGLISVAIAEAFPCKGEP
jgi:hypothetical protein